MDLRVSRRLTCALLAGAISAMALPGLAQETAWVKSKLDPVLELPTGLKKKVYFVESFLADVAHRVMVAGAQNAVDEMGWDMEVLNPENNLERQVKMIEDALAKGDMDALILSAVDSEGVASTVKKVSDRGIPVAIVDRWPSDGEITFGVGGDWYQHGTDATEEMIRRLTAKNGAPKGKILAMIIGMQINPLRDRVTALHDIMKKHPDIEVIEVAAPLDPVGAAQALKDALLANENVDGIWNIADVFGMNFVATMQELGMLKPVGEEGHVILTSMDGTDWALEEIRNGNFDATVSSYLYEWGYLAAWGLGQQFGGRPEALAQPTISAPSKQWNNSAMKDMPNGRYLGLKSFLVTKDNVDDPNAWGNQVKTILK